MNHAAAAVIDADTSRPGAEFRPTENDGGSSAVRMGSFLFGNGEGHFKAIGKGSRSGGAAYISAHGLGIGDAE